MTTDRQTDGAPSGHIVVTKRLDALVGTGCKFLRIPSLLDRWQPLDRRKEESIGANDNASKGKMWVKNHSIRDKVTGLKLFAADRWRDKAKVNSRVN